MKRLSCAVLMVVALLVACSKGGGGPTDPGTAPVIWDLYYEPTSARLGDGGGAITLTMMFGFHDPDKDITTFRGKDPVTGEIQDFDISDTEGIDEIETDIFFFLLAVKTTEKGTWPFEISVLDSRGNESNRLSGTFTVR